MVYVLHAKLYNAIPVPLYHLLKLVYQAFPCNNKLIGTICTEIHLNKNPIQFNKIVLVKNQTVDL